MKFGGTSVADADAIGRVAAIVRRQTQLDGARPPVVVVSALAGVTDRLIGVARSAEDGDGDAAVAGLNDLLERHLTVATPLTTGAARTELFAQVRAEFDGLIGT